MGRWLVVGILLVGHIGVSLAQGTAASWARDFPGYDLGSSIPFDLQAGFLIVVPGRIGEQSGLRFILDTGATRSFLDRQVAGHIGPGTRNAVRSVEFFNFSRTMKFEEAVVGEFQVGPLRSANARMEVTRLADYSELARDSDGIVGLDLLRTSGKLLIDYEGRKVWFSHNLGATGGVSAPQAFRIRIDIQGVQMRLVVDTGFVGIAVYEDRLRRRLRHLRLEGAFSPVELGQLHTTRVRLPGVSIGGAAETTEVFLIKANAKEELQAADGFIGPAALHASRVEFDFDGERLRFR
jgi:predicted aspartyl protease